MEPCNSARRGALIPIRAAIVASLLVHGVGAAAGPEADAPLCMRQVDGAETPSRILNELIVSHVVGSNEAAFWQDVTRMSEAGAYPFVEEVLGPRESPPHYVRLTFLHRREERDPHNVLLFANVNHVLPEELVFQRVADTGIYFKSIEVPRGVRFEYRIIENDPLTGIFAGAKYGTRMHLLGGDPDRLNPNKQIYPDGLGEGEDYVVTWVELPGASRQPYIVDQGKARGELSELERVNARLGHTHKIVVYRPPDHDPARSYPAMILFDADSYFVRGRLQTTLENLIADGSIPPLLVLGINAGRKDGISQRNEEFTCNPRFMEFLADELVPWFTETFNASSDPNRWIIAGSSYGGLFSTYFAFNHPEIVTNVLSQSGSFHWGRDGDEIAYEWLVREFAFGDKKPVSMYMEVGVLEGEYGWSDPGFPHQIVSHRHFKTVLDMRGYNVEYKEYGGGHEMLSWRGGIADGLSYLFRNHAEPSR